MCEKGDYEKGISVAEKALEEAKKNQGNHYPDVAIGLFVLGTGHIGLRDFPRAEPLFRRTLGISEASLGSKHHTTETIREKLLLSSEQTAE